MFGGNCGGCSSAYNYEAAARVFERTPLPKTRSRGASIFSAHERPLDGTRQWHYRVERGTNGDWYDMCLYHTVMARYYRPTSDEARRVLYTNDTSNLSSQYMWRVVSARRLKEVLTTEGIKVASPLYAYRAVEDPWATPRYNPEKFSAALWFDAEGRLDVSKSAHTPHCKYILSADDKAARKDLKERFANLLMLAVMRLPEFEREVSIDYYAGKPFRAAYGSWPANRLVGGLCERRGTEPTSEEAGAGAYFEVCQQIYNTLASKRAYAQGRVTGLGGWGYTSKGSMSTNLEDLERPITSDDFTRAVVAKLMVLAGLDKKTEKVMLPQFMAWDEYPRTGACST